MKTSRCTNFFATVMEWESIQGAVCSMAFFLLVAAGLLSPHPGREGCIQVVYMYFSLFFLNWLISYMYSYDDVDVIANCSGGTVPKHLQSSHCKTPCLSGLHYFSPTPFLDKLKDRADGNFLLEFYTHSTIHTTDAARCAGVVGCTGSQAKLHFLYLLLLHYSYSSRVTLYDLLEILGGNRLTSPSIISPASPTIAVQASLTSRARRKGWQLFVSVYIFYILHI